MVCSVLAVDAGAAGRHQPANASAASRRGRDIADQPSSMDRVPLIAWILLGAFAAALLAVVLCDPAPAHAGARGPHGSSSSPTPVAGSAPRQTRKRPRSRAASRGDHARARRLPSALRDGGAHGSRTSAAASSPCASASSPTGSPRCSRPSSAASRNACGRGRPTSSGPSARSHDEVSTLEQRQRQRIADGRGPDRGRGGRARRRRPTSSAPLRLRLREELEPTAKDALTQALEELQSQADDRRRAIDDVIERLRQHEHAVAEQVDRAESDARARIEPRVRRARAAAGRRARARDRARGRTG